MPARPAVLLFLVACVFVSSILIMSRRLPSTVSSPQKDTAHEYSSSPPPPRSSTRTSVNTPPPPTVAPQPFFGDVHVFYYIWYGSEEVDGQWLHWNHEVLPHWESAVNAKYPSVGSRYSPPDEIGANFYPELGCYSSRDEKVLRRHFSMLRSIGADVVVVSWHSLRGSDSQGAITNEIMPILWRVATEERVKVCFHLEPYDGRTAVSVARDIKYVMETYGDGPTLYRDPSSGLPVFYAYDSYLVPSDDWRKVLSPSSSQSIRGTAHDAVVLSLYLDEKSKRFILDSGFDGFYTYFASTGFTQGSTPGRWKELARWADTYDLLFVPSVGPGYEDTRVRPWNGANSQLRRGGKYYDDMWCRAIESASVVSITSFNEWHEGTQIEPALPSPGAQYLDYSPNEPEFYMQRTQHWIERLRSRERDPVSC